jgi:hypothetical protein
MAFAIEEVPEQDKLFRHIPKGSPNPKGYYVLEQNRFSSVLFKDERLSVNWQRYATVESTIRPNSSHVISLVAKQCTDLGQTVEHTPIEPDGVQPGNQAHAEICGAKDKVIRDQLSRLASIEWEMEDTSASPAIS